jgi:cytochrome b involved in lipid metabolism
MSKEFHLSTDGSSQDDKVERGLAESKRSNTVNENKEERLETRNKDRVRKGVTILVAVAFLVGAVFGIMAICKHMKPIVETTGQEDILDPSVADGDSDQEQQTEAPVLTVSMEELASHNTTADCWVALHGDVYDLTAYAPIHEGGAISITSLAGRDGTDLFDVYHTPHQLLTVQPLKIERLAVANDTLIPCAFDPKCELVMEGLAPVIPPGGDAVVSCASDPNCEIVMEGLGPVIPPGRYTDGNSDQEQQTEAPVLTVSMEQLASHNTVADCWVAFHGDVYDLTTYAPIHEGGAISITSLAGRDGTELFDLYHIPNTLLTVQDRKIGRLAASSDTSTP